MSAAAFTPGPWEVYQVTMFRVGVRMPLGTPTEHFITEANANLIAAAPDLFSALEQLYTSVLSCDMPILSDKRIAPSMIRAIDALHLAKGNR